MESKNPNIASIESQNIIIQDFHPRVEEKVNPQEEQVNPQEEQVNPQEQEQQRNPGREEDVGVDRNVEIVATLSSLRCLSDVFKEGNQLSHLLGQTTETIFGTIRDVQGALYGITSYRELRREFYENDMSYQEVKKLKITKDMFFFLFRDHSNGTIPPTSKPHISIDWCIEPRIKEN